MRHEISTSAHAVFNGSDHISDGDQKTSNVESKQELSPPNRPHVICGSVPTHSHMEYGSHCDEEAKDDDLEHETCQDKIFSQFGFRVAFRGRESPTSGTLDEEAGDITTYEDFG